MSAASTSSIGGQRTPSATLSWAAYPATIALLWFGWSRRNDGYLSPEDGWGYALGIIGSVQLVALLGYSARKRLRALRGRGSLRRWFSTHMALGVLGPVCILFHCNFHLGSVNSSVALGSMLLVAGSGFAGRFFYSKIHYGLYGQRATLESLQHDAAQTDARLSVDLAATPGVYDELTTFAQQVLTPRRSLAAYMVTTFTVGIRTRRAQARLCREVREDLATRAKGMARRNRREARAQARRVQRFIGDHLSLVRRITRFGLYERLFSLWHVLHVPMFAIMALAACAHIVAVHLY